MIRIRKGPTNKIIFEPRAGFKRGKKSQPNLELELIYAHVCSTCGNVIQAQFLTDKEIVLWPYEETVVLSQGDHNMGEVLKIYPDDKAKAGSSCYRSVFNQFGQSSQKLTLKNHVLRYRAIEERKFNGEGLWEVGERTCPKVGVFSVREELTVKDVLLFSGWSEYDFKSYDLSKIKVDDLLEWTYGVRLKRLNAIGQAGPVVLIDRTNVIYSFRWDMMNRLDKFKKVGK
jgi:hypothetical protein